MLNLATARVVGFYSLPSAFLAEYNADAYNARLAEHPKGWHCGTCDNCGMALMHNVLIVTEDGKKLVVGTDCAEKVGTPEIRECVRRRRTADQIAAEKAERAEKAAAWDAKRAAEKQAHDERLAVNGETWGEVLIVLRGQKTEFHDSLAGQLQYYGKVSPRQAEYICKAVIGRRNKKTAVGFDELFDRLTQPLDSRPT